MRTGGGEASPRLLGLCLALVGWCGRLVPRSSRAAFRQEWEAEIYHRWLSLRPGSRHDEQLELLRRSFGALPHALWVLAQEWRWDMLETDLRYALRTLGKSPFFTLIAVSILGLGIGGIAGSFSLLDSFLLRPLPYDDPECLVHLYVVDHQSGLDQGRFPLGAVEELHASTDLFEDLGAYHYQGRNIAGGDAEPEYVMVAYLTSNLLRMLGVEPARGRAFTTAEGEPGAPRVALLGHGIWQSRYGGDPQILGRTIQLDGVAHDVIGVMPAGFQFPFGEIRVWTPIRASAEEYPWEWHNLQPVGRLRRDASLNQAQSLLDGRYRQILEARGEASDYGVAVVPLRKALLFLYDQVSVVFVLILIANGFVLLIICANIANLMISRATGRTREIAIQAVLGAGRGRLVRQLLTEGLLLAVAGALVGLALAHWQARAAEAAIPEALFRVGSLGVDARVLAVTLLVAGASTLFFALAPALQSSRPPLVEVLKEGGATSTGGLKTSRLRKLMVVVQVSLSLVLLVGTALLLQSVVRLQRVDPGFDASNLLTMGVRLTESEYPEGAQRLDFYQRVEQRLKALRGVEGAAQIYPLPMNFATAGRRFEVAGRPPASPDERLQARVHWVSPSLLDTLGITLLEGRGLEAEDRSESERVVLVNRTFAERFWPGAGAVGKRLRFPEREEAEWVTVVGVVSDTKSFFLNEENAPTMFIPRAQETLRESFLLVKTTGDPHQAFPQIRDVLREVDAGLPVSEVRSMEEVLDASMMAWQGASGGLLVVAAVALLLAALGIYGVVAFAVGARRHEIAIRLALGAERRDVLELVARQGLWLVLAGLAIGLALSVALTHFLSGLLFGVEALDPLTFVASVAVLLVVAGLATLLPARRAARLDPVVALRHP